MLFVIYRPWEPQNKLGLPIYIERTYTDEFNEKKPMEAINSRNWRRYNRHKDGVPVPEGLRLPLKMFMFCKGLKRFESDLYSDGLGQWVVSAPLLKFLKEHRLLEGYYEESELIVVSTSKKPITNKQHYLLRFFQNHNDLVDFQSTPKVVFPKKPLTEHTPPTIYYPELVFREEVQVPAMFYLDDPSYWYALICNEDIKAHMEQEKFLGFEFFTLQEYVQERLRREQLFAR